MKMSTVKIYSNILCYYTLILFLISCSTKNNITNMFNDDGDKKNEYHYELDEENKRRIILPINHKDETHQNPTYYFGKKPLLWDNIKPMYENCNDEVLKNCYVEIYIYDWNDASKYCKGILDGILRKKRIWTKFIKESDISLEDLIPLKLYIDSDSLSSGLNECFKPPHKENDIMLGCFYHLNKGIDKAMKKFLTTLSESEKPEWQNWQPIPKLLFHSLGTVNSINLTDIIYGRYDGPLITTTNLQIARSWAGREGMILVLEPCLSKQQTYNDKIKTSKKTILLVSGFIELEFNQKKSINNEFVSLNSNGLSQLIPIIARYYENKRYNILNVSGLSTFANEMTHIIYDEHVNLVNIILSRDYDHYQYVLNPPIVTQETRDCSKFIMPYREGCESIECIKKLHLLIKQVKTTPNKSLKAKKGYEDYRMICDFTTDTIFDNTTKVKILLFLYNFVIKFQKSQIEMYKLHNEFIQTLFNKVHKIIINKELLNELIKQINKQQQNIPVSENSILELFNGYFQNSVFEINK